MKKMKTETTHPKRENSLLNMRKLNNEPERKSKS